jgi:hypothetical protein
MDGVIGLTLHRAWNLIHRCLHWTGKRLQDMIEPEVRRMSARPDYDEKKLAELILYASWRCSDSRTFGKTLLYKILFYSDFIHYGDYGQPITGTSYAHLPNGPGPESSQFASARHSLVCEGRARVEDVECGGGYQRERTVALAEPDMASFSKSEMETIDGVIDSVKCHTASSISSVSHGDVPWLLTRDGEEIPYYSVFVMRHDPVPMEYLALVQEEAAARGIA